MDRHPTQIDRLIAARLRARRKTLGLTRRDVAERMGCSAQNIYNYENGSRITASRLYELSQILGAPVGWFFERDRVDAI